MKVDYNELAENYAKHRQVQPEVLRNLLTEGKVNSNFKVLEAGCGTGNYIKAVEAATGCSCWGIEPSIEMLAVAVKQAPNVHFKQGSAESLGHPADYFDLVFSVDVIHHVGNIPAYFQEAWNTLKPGGQICTVTDSEDIIRQRQPLSVYFPETVEKELQRYPRISDLKIRMVKAGFHSLHETAVEFSYSLHDIQIYRDKAFSCLHLISAEAFERGCRRMEQDLQKGPVACVSRYVLLWGEK